jgi:hypothetical protein
MMATKTEIANIALSWVGANLVTDVDADDSTEAATIRVHYDAALKATLEAQEWSFAIRRFEATLDPTPPLFGYANAFTIPADIVRVLTCDRTAGPGVLLGNPFFEPEQIDWDFEDGRILSNESIVFARGITSNVGEGEFSGLFVQAFAAKLAAFVALPLTQSNQIFASMGGMYTGMMKEAKTRDGMQGRSKRIRQRAFLRVR